MSELAEESDALAPTTACRICRGPYSVKRERGDGEPVSTGRFKAAPSTEGSWLDLFHGLETENVEPKDRMCCKLCFKLLSDYESLREELRKIERRLSTTKKKILKRNAVGSQENVSKYPNGDDGRLDGDDWPLALDAIDEGTDMVPSDVLLVKTEVPDDFSAAEDLQNTLAAVYDERSSAGDTETETPTKKMAPVKKLLKRAREPGKPKGKRKRVKKRLPMSVKCNDCGAICVSSYQLRRHMISVHKTSYYNCPACDRQFSMWRMMKVHVSEHEARGEWLTCKKDGCTEGFATYRDLCEHRLKHHRQKYYEGNFPCKYSPPCEAVFKTQYARKIHYNESHRVERPHVCEICGDCWETRKSCQKHVSRHKKKEELDAVKKKKEEKSEAEKEAKDDAEPDPSQLIYGCPVCEMKFANRHAKARHLEEHDSTCPICGKKLSNTQTLVYHMPMHFPSQKISCEICGILFATKNNLDKHVKRHNDTTKYQCDTCGKFFNHQNSLESHIRSAHQTQEAFHCKVCGKFYGRFSDLKTHMAIVHDGSKRNVCKICGLSFKYSSGLARHRFSQHQAAKYRCQLCNKSFSSWNNRYSHMYTHTDTKPYECRICGAGYPRKPAAVAHVRSSHPDICNISTPGPDHFVKHNAPNLPDDIMKAAAEYADPQQQAARYGNVSEPTDIKSVDVKSNDDSSTIGSSTPTPQQTPLTIPWNLSTNAAPHPDSYPPSMSIPLPSMMMPGTSLLDSSHLLQFQSSLRPKE